MKVSASTLRQLTGITSRASIRAQGYCSRQQKFTGVLLSQRFISHTSRVAFPIKIVEVSGELIVMKSNHRNEIDIVASVHFT